MRWIRRECAVTWLIVALALGTGPAVGQDDADPAQHPFDLRVPVPEFPDDTQWLNVGGPLTMKDLRGKFVLLDFWTYCCINCLHILPELKKLEHAYPNQLVVIGIHSAKFEAERARNNIEEAILRYEIEHPVVNDHQHLLWNTFGARSWPTVLLIDPEGNAVWGTTGEIQFEDVDAIIRRGLPYYRAQELLDETPLHFDLLAHQTSPSPLRFPGKILADEVNRRLFIADSNHNRIVISSLEGDLQDVIGSGEIGSRDGDFANAQFDHPQGMSLDGETLYVADTENHLLRKVDLRARAVQTIAGTGRQGRNPWPGLEQLGPQDAPPERWVGPPGTTPLNSPWALWIHDDQLYIAMAGPHQIWKMPLDESEIGPYAGNGREDIVDGPLLPPFPYQTGYASFAQPSGLTSDGNWLYVADSEGSSVRAVPFDAEGQVRTVVGTNRLPQARLFTFGDRDGAAGEVLLQHVLGVAYHDGQIYAADTYNNKIKAIDAHSGRTRTLAGDGTPGKTDEPARFDEPGGLSYAAGRLFVADTNNHLIRTLDITSGEVTTLTIAGLEPPPSSQAEPPDFSRAAQIEVPKVSLRPEDGHIELQVQLRLPERWKLNPLAPAEYWIKAIAANGPVQRTALGRTELEQPSPHVRARLPVRGEGEDVLQLAMDIYYCQEGSEGLCRIASVAWTVPLEISSAAAKSQVLLEYQLER